MEDVDIYKEYAVKMFVGTTGDFEDKAKGVIDAFCGALDMNNYQVARKSAPPVNSAEVKMLYWALREYTEKHLDDEDKARELHDIWSRIVNHMR